MDNSEALASIRRDGGSNRQFGDRKATTEGYTLVEVFDFLAMSVSSTYENDPLPSGNKLLLEIGWANRTIDLAISNRSLNIRGP